MRAVKKLTLALGAALCIMPVFSQQPAAVAAPETHKLPIISFEEERPHWLNHPNPKYPFTDKWKHIEGNVVIDAIVSKDGTIATLKLISSPDASLAKAAMSTVKKWTYRPFVINGQASDVEIIITVKFFNAADAS
jgi:periplasmic protein TonB